MRGYISMEWPDSWPTWIVGGFHWTAWIFIRVWFITLLINHLILLFLFLEGGWSDTFDIWLLSSRSRPIRVNWMCGALSELMLPWGYLVLLIGTPLVFPIFLRFLFWVSTWPVQGACRNFQGLFSRRKDSLLLSDKLRMSEVLLNLFPSYIWLASVDGPVIALCWQIIIYKVLEIAIYNPYYLLFLTCLKVSLSQCTTHV